MAATYRTISVDALEDGAVVRVLLNQPKGNILTMGMMRELDEALRALRDHRHLKLVIVRGAGGHFSFGASVEEHRRAQAPDMLRGFHAFLRELVSFPVPVAALVEGRCLGGGFELALCCHLMFATPGARFGCPEIKLGVFPPVFAVVGPLRMPGAIAERMLVTGEDIDVEVAGRAGLLAGVFDQPDPEAALMEWYRRNLAPLSAFALRQAVAAARHASGLMAAMQDALAETERRYITDVVSSHDGNEGIEAFLARRAPDWQDR
ncbi:MAG TPA: enoyl-CoA hydratase/isomerase family protein [Gemmatimonadaceae bacterium]|nr:enoyl-CoA hydratase/isomerase family protein [Gemmatimonadaceae bacterium]